MMDNQPVNLQWKISVNSFPRSNRIFRCIKEGLRYCESRDCHRGLWSSVEKALHINVLKLEVLNSSFNKIQKTKYDSSTDRQHDSSLFFIKHGRNAEQIFDRNLEKSLGLFHREEKIFVK